MTKEWLTVYKGHKIRVVNTWFSGAKLYVDDECKDTNQQLFSTDATRPILTAKLGDESVEIFMKSILTTKAKICVGGEQVGGDVF